MQINSVIALLIGLPCLAAAQQASGPGYAPTGGFVPDSATAVRIAVAVWIPLFGEGAVMKQQPFVATLKDSSWTVHGTLKCPAGRETGCVVTGGVAMAVIAKRDGTILSIAHGQ